MSPSAKVTSMESLEHFRLFLCDFVETSREALGSVEMELHRMIDWLEHEQPAYWKNQIRRRREEIDEAKAALSRKQIAAVDSTGTSLIEEKKALQRAKRRIEEAEEKVELVRRWTLEIRRAVDEYQVRAGQLSTLLEGDPPSFIVLLGSIIDSLDTYVSAAPPVSAPATSASSSSSTMSRGTPETSEEARRKDEG